MLKVLFVFLKKRTIGQKHEGEIWFPIIIFIRFIIFYSKQTQYARKQQCLVQGNLFLLLKYCVKNNSVKTKRGTANSWIYSKHIVLYLAYC